MKEKIFLEDYNIKEIYNNYDIFKEKYPSLTNVLYFSFNNLYKNNLYSKIKFVKILKEYKNTLDNMPYIHKYSDYIIEEILENITEAETDNIEKSVKYDLNSKKIIFNKKFSESEISNDMMSLLTEVALLRENKHENVRNYQGVLKARNEYIGNKLVNIKNNLNYNNTPYNNTITFNIYNRMVSIFGENIMLNLNSDNLLKISQKFEEKNESFEIFSKEMTLLYNKDSSELRKSILNDSLNKILDIVENRKRIEIENEEYVSPDILVEIKDFQKLLHTVDNIPFEIKEKMYENLRKGVRKISIKKANTNFSGRYYSSKKVVELNNYHLKDNDLRKKVLLHELMHAALTSRDKLNFVIKQGFANVTNTVGMGFNEGATEYFAHKLYENTNRRDIQVGYEELVNIVKDMVALYGEDVIIEAMVKSPKRLEKLMMQDNKSYFDFIQITDDYYRYVYQNDSISSCGMKKNLKARQKYEKIGSFIEEIKEHRKLSGFNYVMTTSHWKNSMELFGKQNIFEKFKESLFIIKSKFFIKKEEKRLIEENSYNNNDEKRKEFKKQLQVNKYDLLDVPNQRRSEEKSIQR